MTTFWNMDVFSKNVNYGSYDKNGRVKKLAVVRSSLEIDDSNSGGSLAPNAYMIALATYPARVDF